MFNGLRDEVSPYGLSQFDLELPGESSTVALLDGGLRLAAAERGGFVLETVDYGRGHLLGRAATEDQARRLLLDYVVRPLPPARVLPRSEFDRLIGEVAKHYVDLRDRASAAGSGGVVIDIPPGIPVDRIGALDGVHLFPADTPFEFRSLPPAALRPESDLRQLLTTGTVRVSAAIVQPWFGRPGGGLRFTLQEPGAGIRDLIVAGVLQRLQVGV